ncbi:MAG: RdgB/HAM1 family non-canonical purine NTP pyrophosphatase [Spirochaetia bacterium]|nr:RdgB/HAM1 family non-canonical purine NTP pyrophosphatase [Spirochaetia bacterium]
MKDSIEKVFELYCSTENDNKLKEINNYINKYLELKNKIIIKSVKDLSENLKEKYNPEENSETFLNNAFIKAKSLYDLIKKPVFAEDSGLEVKALNNRPGVQSARYAKTNSERIEKLLFELKSFEGEERKANFTTCLCYLDIYANPIYFFGRVDGFISEKPSGVNGFGYDPVFYYPPLNKTFAEISMEEKQSVSHRAKALKLFLNFLTKQLEKDMI